MQEITLQEITSAAIKNCLNHRNWRWKYFKDGSIEVAWLGSDDIIYAVDLSHPEVGGVTSPGWSQAAIPSFIEQFREWTPKAASWMAENPGMKKWWR